MKTRKFLAVLLSLAMTLSLLPVGVFADDDPTPITAQTTLGTLATVDYAGKVHTNPGTGNKVLLYQTASLADVELFFEGVSTATTETDITAASTGLAAENSLTAVEADTADSLTADYYLVAIEVEDNEGIGTVQSAGYQWVRGAKGLSLTVTNVENEVNKVKVSATVGTNNKLYAKVVNTNALDTQNVLAWSNSSLTVIASETELEAEPNQSVIAVETNAAGTRVANYGVAAVPALNANTEIESVSFASGLATGSYTFGDTEDTTNLVADNIGTAITLSALAAPTSAYAFKANEGATSSVTITLTPKAAAQTGVDNVKWEKTTTSAISSFDTFTSAAQTAELANGAYTFTVPNVASTDVIVAQVVPDDGYQAMNGTDKNFYSFQFTPATAEALITKATVEVTDGQTGADKVTKEVTASAASADKTNPTVFSVDPIRLIDAITVTGAVKVTLTTSAADNKIYRYNDANYSEGGTELTVSGTDSYTAECTLTTLDTVTPVYLKAESSTATTYYVLNVGVTNGFNAAALKAVTADGKSASGLSSTASNDPTDPMKLTIALAANDPSPRNNVLVTLTAAENATVAAKMIATSTANTDLKDADYTGTVTTAQDFTANEMLIRVTPEGGFPQYYRLKVTKEETTGSDITAIDVTDNNGVELTGLTHGNAENDETPFTFNVGETDDLNSATLKLYLANKNDKVEVKAKSTDEYTDESTNINAVANTVAGTLTLTNFDLSAARTIRVTPEGSTTPTTYTITASEEVIATVGEEATEAIYVMSGTTLATEANAATGAYVLTVPVALASGYAFVDYEHLVANDFKVTNLPSGITGAAVALKDATATSVNLVITGTVADTAATAEAQNIGVMIVKNKIKATSSDDTVTYPVVAKSIVKIGIANLAAPATKAITVASGTKNLSDDYKLVYTLTGPTALTVIEDAKDFVTLDATSTGNKVAIKSAAVASDGKITVELKGDDTDGIVGNSIPELTFAQSYSTTYLVDAKTQFIGSLTASSNLTITVASGETSAVTMVKGQKNEATITITLPASQTIQSVALATDSDQSGAATKNAGLGLGTVTVDATNGYTATTTLKSVDGDENAAAYAGNTTKYVLKVTDTSGNVSILTGTVTTAEGELTASVTSDGTTAIKGVVNSDAAQTIKLTGTIKGLTFAELEANALAAKFKIYQNSAGILQAIDGITVTGVTTGEDSTDSTIKTFTITASVANTTTLEAQKLYVGIDKAAFTEPTKIGFISDNTDGLKANEIVLNTGTATLVVDSAEVEPNVDADAIDRNTAISGTITVTLPTGLTFKAAGYTAEKATGTEPTPAEALANAQLRYFTVKTTKDGVATPCGLEVTGVAITAGDNVDTATLTLGGTANALGAFVIESVTIEEAAQALLFDENTIDIPATGLTLAAENNETDTLTVKTASTATATITNVDGDSKWTISGTTDVNTSTHPTLQITDAVDTKGNEIKGKDVKVELAWANVTESTGAPTFTTLDSLIDASANGEGVILIDLFNAIADARKAGTYAVKVTQIKEATAEPGQDLAVLIANGIVNGGNELTYTLVAGTASALAAEDTLGTANETTGALNPVTLTVQDIGDNTVPIPQYATITVKRNNSKFRITGVTAKSESTPLTVANRDITYTINDDTATVTVQRANLNEIQLTVAVKSNIYNEGNAITDGALTFTITNSGETTAFGSAGPLNITSIPANSLDVTVGDIAEIATDRLTKNESAYVDGTALTVPFTSTTLDAGTYKVAVFTAAKTSTVSGFNDKTYSAYAALETLTDDAATEQTAAATIVGRLAAPTSVNNYYFVGVYDLMLTAAEEEGTVGGSLALDTLANKRLMQLLPETGTTQTLYFAVDGVPNVASKAVTVNPGVPYTIEVTGTASWNPETRIYSPAPAMPIYHSGESDAAPITITIKDQFGNVVDTAVEVTMEGNGFSVLNAATEGVNKITVTGTWTQTSSSAELYISYTGNTELANAQITFTMPETLDKAVTSDATNTFTLAANSTNDASAASNIALDNATALAGTPITLTVPYGVFDADGQLIETFTDGNSAASVTFTRAGESGPSFTVAGEILKTGATSYRITLSSDKILDGYEANADGLWKAGEYTVTKVTIDGVTNRTYINEEKDDLTISPNYNSDLTIESAGSPTVKMENGDAIASGNIVLTIKDQYGNQLKSESNGMVTVKMYVTETSPATYTPSENLTLTPADKTTVSEFATSGDNTGKIVFDAANIHISNSTSAMPKGYLVYEVTKENGGKEYAYSSQFRVGANELSFEVTENISSDTASATINVTDAKIGNSPITSTDGYKVKAEYRVDADTAPIALCDAVAVSGGEATLTINTAAVDESGNPKLPTKYGTYPITVTLYKDDDSSVLTTRTVNYESKAANEVTLTVALTPADDTADPPVVAGDPTDNGSERTYHFTASVDNWRLPEMNKKYSVRVEQATVDGSSPVANWSIMSDVKQGAITSTGYTADSITSTENLSVTLWNKSEKDDKPAALKFTLVDANDIAISTTVTVDDLELTDFPTKFAAELTGVTTDHPEAAALPANAFARLYKVDADTTLVATATTSAAGTIEFSASDEAKVTADGTTKYKLVVDANKMLYTSNVFTFKRPDISTDTANSTAPVVLNAPAYNSVVPAPLHDVLDTKNSVYPNPVIPYTITPTFDDEDGTTVNISFETTEAIKLHKNQSGEGTPGYWLGFGIKKFWDDDATTKLSVSNNGVEYTPNNSVETGPFDFTYVDEDSGETYCTLYTDVSNYLYKDMTATAELYANRYVKLEVTQDGTTYTYNYVLDFTKAELAQPAVVIGGAKLNITTISERTYPFNLRLTDVAINNLTDTQKATVTIGIKGYENNTVTKDKITLVKDDGTDEIKLADDLSTILKGVPAGEQTLVVTVKNSNILTNGEKTFNLTVTVESSDTGLESVMVGNTDAETLDGKAYTATVDLNAQTVDVTVTAANEEAKVAYKTEAGANYGTASDYSTTITGLEVADGKVVYIKVTAKDGLTAEYTLTLSLKEKLAAPTISYDNTSGSFVFTSDQAGVEFEYVALTRGDVKTLEKAQVAYKTATIDKIAETLKIDIKKVQSNGTFTMVDDPNSDDPDIYVAVVARAVKNGEPTSDNTVFTAPEIEKAKPSVVKTGTAYYKLIIDGDYEGFYVATIWKTGDVTKFTNTKVTGLTSTEVAVDANATNVRFILFAGYADLSSDDYGVSVVDFKPMEAVIDSGE